MNGGKRVRTRRREIGGERKKGLRERGEEGKERRREGRIVGGLDGGRKKMRKR